MYSRDLLTAAARPRRELPRRPARAPCRAGRGRPRRPAGALGGPLPEGPSDPRAVLDALVEGAGPGLMASQSPRFFGFVIGGALPAALAADWLASAWDQNAGLYVAAPAAAVVEEVAGGWLLDLLGLPGDRVVRLRHRLPDGPRRPAWPRRATTCSRAPGWDVEARRPGAARRRSALLASGERHVTIDARRCACSASAPAALVPRRRRRRGAHGRRGAARGARRRRRPDDRVRPGRQREHRRLRPARRDRATPPTQHGAWVHVDGAFGLWAAAAPSHRAPRRRASSAPTRGPPTRHKWLNVPYDCGLAFVAHPERAPRRDRRQRRLPARTRRRASATRCDWTPEFSRRARGVRGLGGAALARPRGRRRAGRALLRVRAPVRRGPRRRATASRCSTTWSSTRCWCASATTTPRPTRSSRRCRPTARAG